MNCRRQRGVWVVLALCLAAPLAWAAAAAARATVQKVELSAVSADSARLVLSVSAMPAHKMLLLASPDRIVIDLSGARLAAGVRMPKAAGPVRVVRSGMQAGKPLRLVIELTHKLAADVRTSGSQLTIDIGALPAASVAAEAVPVRAAHAPADTGRDVIVAVDAGHGGADPGASGANRTREKDVVLAIARALAKRIDAEPGMRAVLTRHDDRFIALRDRITVARNARADIFVSVHADAIKNRDVTGSSVYVLSERGASSEAARLLAQGENAADLKGGIALGEMAGDLQSVLMDVSQTRSIGLSMEAADRVLQHLDGVGTVRKTKVQQAGFVVLKSPDIPSMLVETAYISNPGEERKLRDPKHQAAVAEAIFSGVREYFRGSPPDGTWFAQQRDARRGVAPVVPGSALP